MSAVIKLFLMGAMLFGLVMLALSNPIYLSPEFLVPIGFGVFMLLLALILKARQFPSWYRSRGKPTLDPGQLEGLMIGDPPMIVDLRPRRDYTGPKGHIRSAVNIPFAEFQKHLKELDPKSSRTIVLVDDTDKLSHQALPMLAASGHRWNYVLKGGLRAWRRTKLPVYVAQENPKH